MKIAFIGTGLMGIHMARNLLKAGFDVTAWNRTRQKAEPLLADGAKIADSAAAAVNSADVVITMVNDGPAVNAILFQANLAADIAKGATVIDMSSIKPGEARLHGEKLAALGIAHLDAPVSGGTKGAEQASLAIMAGGDKDVFEKVRPVLAAMGRPVLVGPAGCGQLAKLANQGIVAVTIGVVAEAMLLMRQGGADPDKLREALKGGFADSIILQQHGQRMVEGNFVPGGRSAFQLKDLVNLAEEAGHLGLSLPLAEMQRDRFDHLVKKMDGGDLDHSALFLELLERNGL